MDRPRLDLVAWSSLQAAKLWIALTGIGVGFIALTLVGAGMQVLESRGPLGVGTPGTGLAMLMGGVAGGVAALVLLASVYATRRSLRRTLHLTRLAWWSLAVATLMMTLVIVAAAIEAGLAR